MSWIWEKSATWRKLVAITKHSPAAMVAFTVAMVVVPYGLGKVVMTGTNPQKETDLERQLRSRATLEHKVRLQLQHDASCYNADPSIDWRVTVLQ